MLYAYPAGRLLLADFSRRFFIGLILFLSLLHPYSNSIAQSEIKIAGRVIDNLSGSPIQGASVSIEGYGRTVTTDGDGRFYFVDLPSGKYTILASRIGYRQEQTVEVDIEGIYRADVIISMNRSPVMVAGQSVSAERHDIFKITRSGAVTVIEITDTGQSSIARLTEQLPELELVESANRQFLRIRGAAINATAVMLDGRLLNSPLDSRADISTIPFESVSKVEVVTGGNYRMPGLAGTVNFITDINRKNTTLAVERGSFDRERYSAGGNLSYHDKVIFSIDGHSGFERGNFEFTNPRDSIETRDNNFDRSSGLFGAVLVKRNAVSIKINSRYFQRKAGVPGAVFQATPKAVSQSEELEFAAGIEKLFSENKIMNIDMGLIRREAEFDSPRTPTTFIPFKTSFDENARDIRIGFSRTGRIDLNTFFSTRYESLRGDDLIRHDLSFGFRSRQLNALASGIDYRFTVPYLKSEKSAVTLGVRDEWGEGGNVLLPSASLRINADLLFDTGIDFSWSEGRRLPDLTDLYWKEDVFATPNPDLKMEKSENYQAGIDLKSRKAGLANLRISRFLNRYDDLIIWRKWAGDKFKPVNLSKADIDGWEFSIEYIPLAGPARFYWAGSYIRPLNKEDEQAHHDKYLTFRPIGSQTAIIEFNYKRFDFLLKGKHIGKRYTTEENTKSLPAVDLFDCEARIRFNIPRVKSSLELGISNIGNIQYEILDRQPEKPREYRAKLTISSKGDSL